MRKIYHFEILTSQFLSKMNIFLILKIYFLPPHSTHYQFPNLLYPHPCPYSHTHTYNLTMFLIPHVQTVGEEKNSLYPSKFLAGELI